MTRTAKGQREANPPTPGCGWLPPTGGNEHAARQLGDDVACTVRGGTQNGPAAEVLTLMQGLSAKEASVILNVLREWLAGHSGVSP